MCVVLQSDTQDGRSCFDCEKVIHTEHIQIFDLDDKISNEIMIDSSHQ